MHKQNIMQTNLQQYGLSMHPHCIQIIYHPQRPDNNTVLGQVDFYGIKICLEFPCDVRPSVELEDLQGLLVHAQPELARHENFLIRLRIFPFIYF